MPSINLLVHQDPRHNPVLLCIDKTSNLRATVNKNTFLNKVLFVNSYEFSKILFFVLFEQYSGAPLGRVPSIGKSENTRDTKTIKFPDLP